MKNNRIQILAVAVVVTVICGTSWATLLQDKKPRRVTRVKRPTFSQRDWDGIYFENLFQQGLIGPRPKTILLILDSVAVEPATSAADSSAMNWASFIPNDVVEDEIKSLENLLQRDVTTPVKFKSEYAKARQSFSMLSMLFAIIREYENDDVRWKKYAPVAQAAFARAAANASVGSQQSYQNAKRTREDLTEMVRGGAFSGNDKAPEILQWPRVVDRGPMMKRLQAAIDNLNPLMSNKSQFANNIDRIYHEASIIAAIGQVLIREDMDEADEDDYAQYAKAMSAAAVELVAATRNQNFEAGSKSVNQIEQSCSNCHEDWR